MGSLLVLDLRYNQISKVRSVKFPSNGNSLDQLLLGFNRICNVDSLFPVERQGDGTFGTIFNRLTVLDIKENKIRDFPIGILLLSNLKVLDMSNNDLEALPCYLGYMRSLRSLKLEGNRLRKIRREILLSGAEKLLDYLRCRDSNEEARKDEIFEYHLAQNAGLSEQRVDNQQKDIEVEQNKANSSTAESKEETEEKENDTNCVNLATKANDARMNLKEQIARLENQLEVNFNINKFQRQAYKKQLAKLRAEYARLKSQQ